MNKAFVSHLLRENPALFTEIYRFNYRPATYVHREQVEPRLSWDIFQRMVVSSRGERRLSHWLLESKQLRGNSCWSFEDTRRRLALLDSASLLGLVDRCGALVHSARIRQTIERRAVLDLKQALGEEAYTFGVKRAPFLITGLPEWLQQLGASFVREGRLLVRETGLHCLSLCFAGEPEAITGRLRLKLPVTATLAAVEADDERREYLARLLKRIVLSDLNPEWKSCFN